MKLLCTFIFATTCSLAIFSSCSPPESNWTEADKKQYKSECLRGIQQSNPNTTTEQKNDYCDCATEKIAKDFPNKHSQLDMELIMKIANECSRQHL